MVLLERLERPHLVDNEGTRLLPAALCRNGDAWLVIANCPICDIRMQGKMLSDENGEPWWDSFHVTARQCDCEIPDRYIRLAEVCRRESARCDKKRGAHGLERHGRLERGSFRLFCRECSPQAEAHAEHHEWDTKHPNDPVAVQNREADAAGVRRITWQKLDGPYLS